MYQHNPDYFITIVECGSLTKASERLYVSQPSLSKYIKRLESNLGVQLFDRTSSPLRLTFAGERYYRYVLDMQRMDKDLHKEFQDISNQQRGRIRLGIALWRGACLLPDIFPQFHAQYPGIEIELFEGRSNQLEKALINDNIDLAVMNLPQSLDYAKLTCETIFEEPILLAAPSRHPEVQKLLADCRYIGPYPVAPLDFILHFPLILTKPGQNLTVQIMSFLSKHHLTPSILMDTGNLTTAINLAAEGIAATFVPEEGAKVCERPGKIIYLFQDCPELRWPLAVVYRKDSYLPELSRIFIEELKKTLGKHLF